MGKNPTPAAAGCETAPSAMSCRRRPATKLPRASRPAGGKGPSKASGTCKPGSAGSVLASTVPAASSQATPRR